MTDPISKAIDAFRDAAHITRQGEVTNLRSALIQAFEAAGYARDYERLLDVKGLADEWRDVIAPKEDNPETADTIVRCADEVLAMIYGSSAWPRK